MHEPQALERALREDECLRLYERDDVGRARKAVEEADFTEQVAGLKQADALRAVVRRHSTSNEPREMMKNLRSRSPSWTAKSLGLYSRACVILEDDG